MCEAFAAMAAPEPWEATCDRCGRREVIAHDLPHTTAGYRAMEREMWRKGWSTSIWNRGKGPGGGRFDSEMNEPEGDLCPACTSEVDSAPEGS